LEGNTQDPSDAENYLLLIEQIRARMTPGKAITIAQGMNPAYIATQSNNNAPGNVLSRICGALDWVNLMTYDYHGSWNDYTGHLAPLYPSGNPMHNEGWDASSGVELMLAAGCPAEKLVLGVPFYGRTWTGATGLWEQGATPGCGSFEKANRDFTDIDLNLKGKNGYVEHWDDVSKVPYLHNPQTGDFVSYDDARSIGLKAQYVNSKGLGGIMAWEMSNDREEVLFDAIIDNLDGCSSRRTQDTIV
jgi:chitinase